MTILTGDCLDLMRGFPDNSFDSIVTDPPYGFGFMGHNWDKGVPGVAFWIEALRVLKPGAYLLAFAGTRTQHRMCTNIEDAGFEIRDMIAWVYASGFPKHASCLKPALEPITMARKPAKVATLLNIDACRIGNDTITTNGSSKKSTVAYGDFAGMTPSDHTGRWPANLIHDGSAEVLALFPDSNGSGGSLPNVKITGYGDGIGKGTSEYFGGERIPHDSGAGSAARFFYCAKASRKDRDEGLNDFEPTAAAVFDQRPSGDFAKRMNRERPPVVSRNNHPTVKPTDLMQHLVRLVTPAGGCVLDPFAGSGTTGKACAIEGFTFIGMELSPEYAAIAQARCDAARAKINDAK